jgi:hypothetical protein
MYAKERSEATKDLICLSAAQVIKTLDFYCFPFSALLINLTSSVNENFHSLKKHDKNRSNLTLIKINLIYMLITIDNMNIYVII